MYQCQRRSFVEAEGEKSNGPGLSKLVSKPVTHCQSLVLCLAVVCAIPGSETSWPLLDLDL